MNQSIIRASASVRSYNLLQFTKETLKGAVFFVENWQGTGPRKVSEGHCHAVECLSQQVMHDPVLCAAPALGSREQHAGANCGERAQELRRQQPLSAALRSGCSSAHGRQDPLPAMRCRTLGGAFLTLHLSSHLVQR